VHGTGVLKLVPVEAQPVSDERVLARIAAGDRNALAELHARYQRALFRYLCQLTSDRGLAEEILQDTLVAAWRGAAGYEGRASVHAWLLGIARRCADDHLAGRLTATADEADFAAAGDLESEAIRRIDVRAAVAELDERDRDLIALRYGADLTARQIAELLELKTNAVEVALHRALGRLRALLEDEPETAASSGL
jgi:RNA polymerase sigma-70 factor (ECF subfamily)